MIGCPICLSTYVFPFLRTPARADITHHQHVSQDYAELRQTTNRQQPPFTVPPEPKQQACSRHNYHNYEMETHKVLPRAIHILRL